MKKININALLKNQTLLYPLTTIITSLSNYMILIFLWKKLGPSEFGILMILDLFPLILMNFMTFSLDQYIMRHYYEWCKNERDYNLFYIWRLSILTSTIVLFISVLLVIYFQEKFISNINYLSLSILTIINVYITAIYNVPFSVIRITERAKEYFTVKIISLAVYILSVIIFVFIFNFKLQGYFFSLILSSISHLLTTLVYQRSFIFYNNKSYLGKLNFSNIYYYCIPLIPANLFGSLVGIIERYFLQKFIKIEEIGFYSMANKFVELINQVHGIIKLSYGPALFKNISSKILVVNDFAQNVKNYIFPILLTFVLIFSFSFPLMRTLKINNADQIFDIMFFLSISVLIYTLQIYLAPGPIVLKKTETKLGLDVFNTLLVSIMAYFSLKYFNLLTMLQLKILAALIYVILSVLITHKYMKWDIDSKFIWFNIVFVLILAIINYFNSRLDINIILVLLFLIINIKKYKISYEFSV